MHRVLPSSANPFHTLSHKHQCGWFSYNIPIEFVFESFALVLHDAIENSMESHDYFPCFSIAFACTHTLIHIYIPTYIVNISAPSLGALDVDTQMKKTKEKKTSAAAAAHKQPANNNKICFTLRLNENRGKMLYATRLPHMECTMHILFS